MKGAIVDRAVSEERHGYALGLEQFETVTRARCLKNAGTDNAAGAHQANLRRQEMHRAATAARATGCPSEQLRDEFHGRQPFRERVAMSAVGAEHDIILPQCRANTDGHGLLPHISVARAMDQPALMATGELLL